MPKLDHLRPSGLHNNPAYSHVVTATGARTIYISGQVATDDEGRIVGEGDIAAQTTQVMQNRGMALKAAGASYSKSSRSPPSSSATSRSYARSSARRARCSSKTEAPASTLVGVSALAAPEWMIEIEAIAVVD